MVLTPEEVSVALDVVQDSSELELVAWALTVLELAEVAALCRVLRPWPPRDFGERANPYIDQGPGSSSRSGRGFFSLRYSYSTCGERECTKRRSGEHYEVVVDVPVHQP